MLTILFLSRFVIVYIKSKKQTNATARMQPQPLPAEYQTLQGEY